MQQLDLTIEGMHCGACVRRVTNALTAVPGVRIESVDVGSAKVDYDPSTASADQIAAAVDKIGFKASPKASR